ncbi:hypothetical protein DTO166G4_6360 [Paecilomyces variotii]|nr:hypothetical protein DTO166G4_6360 [Paecilomyces variotii]KAJ9241286.1 hypothetical protein DTO166G5_1448 [Paecilomyces variotii]KAJ9381915.1 hypothetical protein DTO063F5_6042 [Paecilomyces variotii]
MPRIVTRYIRKISRFKGSPREGAAATVSSSSAPEPEKVLVSLRSSSVNCSVGDNNAAARKNAAFEEAWRSHFEELTEEEKKNDWREGSQHVSPEMIHDKIVNLDTKHATGVSRKVIEPTLQFLQAIDSLVTGATAAAQSSPIGSIVLGVIRVIIDSAIKAGTYFERLSQMLERMPSRFEILQRYADISASSPAVHKILVASYSNILTFFRKAYRVFVDKEGAERRFASARIFVRSQWSPFEEEYGKILSDFEHYNQMLREMALVENFNYIVERHEAIWEEMKAKKDEEREKFLSWVSGDDSEVDHDRLYSKRYPDTGRWLLEEKCFTDWLDDDDDTPLFWCHGQAGIGKSVLSSIVVDHLSKSTLTDQYALGFWYCKWDDTSMETMACCIIGMFIKQLCRKMFTIPSEILEFRRRLNKEGRTLLFKDYTELFLLCARYFKRVFLTIDALDECKDEQRELILDFVQSFAASHIKVFLASRWMQDIEKACVTKAVILPITAWEVKDDITIFVEHQVPEKLSIKSADIRGRVINTLVDKSEGLFLWVELQLKDLSKVPECDLEDQLQYLPTGLDAMYIRMIRSIKKLPRASSSLARRCMLWVTYAKRPLTGSELKELVSFMASPSGSNQDHDSMSCSSHKHYSSEDITNSCFGLFQMDIDSEPVRPVHYSMQEVFSNRTDTEFPDDCRDFFLSPEKANLQLAKACIRVLLSEELCWDNARKYCARYFESHIFSLQTIPPELENMLDSLLSADREMLANILTFRYPYGFCDCCMGSPREIEPSFFVQCTGLDRVPCIASKYLKVILSDRPEQYLQLSCYLGLSDVLEAIIETGADLNYKDQVGYTALDCACLAKQHDVIKRLLDTGVPQKCSPSGPSSPVIRAAKMKDFRSVELLLRGGMSVNLSDYIRAIDTDDLDTVKLIITSLGEGIDQQTYQNAIHAAAMRGFTDITRFLIDGLDSDALQLMLCYVLATSSEKRIRTLALKYKPDWSLCLKMDRRVLRVASYSGDLETMNRLIENGAEIDARDDDNETALYSAVKCGQVQAAALLLEKGSDTTVISKKQGTLLEAASRYTSPIEMMKLLIKHGAIVNQAHTEKGGPLGVAAAGQDLEKMKFLLANGADINLPQGSWGSPLGTAVAKDCRRSVNFLLENGAEVDISCPRYGSPLGLAAYDGSLEIMGLLIENGADVNRQGGLFGCPLGAAAYRGNTKAMRILLKEGAEVNMAGGFYGSPLGAAAVEDNIEAMNILFERGADINIQGGPFGTPLGIAAWGRAIEFLRPRYTNGLQLLLEKGADVNAPCGLFRDALEVAFFSCHADAIAILSKKVENVEPPCPLSREYDKLLEMAKSVEVQKWFLPKQKKLDRIKLSLSR